MGSESVDNLLAYKANPRFLVQCAFQFAPLLLIHLSSVVLALSQGQSLFDEVVVADVMVVEYNCKAIGSLHDDCSHCEMKNQLTGFIQF